MYHILPYSYNKARELGVNIYPSKKPGKKIDVYNIFFHYHKISFAYLPASDESLR